MTKECHGKDKEFANMKLIGIYTKNFSLYHDLIDEINKRKLKFVVISKPEKVSHKVGVVITSSLEKREVACKHVIAADNFRTISDTLDRALQILMGKEYYKELVIGIDPGEYPGIALIGDGNVIQSWCAASVKDALNLIKRLVENFEANKKTIRIGHGSRMYRDRLLRGLTPLNITIEIVDETKTSPQTGFSREERNKQAAVKIGGTPGKIFESIKTKKPTRGEIRNIQRQSRILSKGKITISEEMAKKVLEGKISLEEAIESE